MTNLFKNNKLFIMKRFIKLIPAALAIVTLASCSTDDLFDSNGKSASKNTLNVNVEQFDGINTRAVREWKGSDLNFQVGDEIRVYDNDLFKFDIYSFADGKFTRSNEKTNIASIAYAAFPAEDVKRGYFEADGSVKLEMSIPSEITYDETKEDIVGDKIAYSSDLPMWGTAQADGDGAKADLYHLTGVLAIKVTNMLQNVEHLILTSATQDISGTFVATLDAENPTTVQLGKGGDDLITSNQIVIDLTSVPSQTSVIYVPVLAGVNDLQVYADKTFDDVVTLDEKVADYTSTYTFERNKFKTLTADFGIGSSTPGQLSALLDSYKSTLEDKLTIDLEKFYVGTNGGSTDANYDGSNIIGIPASDAEIVINFKTGMTYGNADNVGYEGAGIIIQDADDAEPYTGKLTFNVGSLLSAATDITIDMPEADVVLVGDFATKCAANKIQFLAAKSLTIGDGTTTTAIKSDGTNDFVFVDGFGAGVKELTVAAKATLTTTNPIVFDKITTQVNVAGKIDGDIAYKDQYSLFNLNITGDATAAAQIDGDVKTIGNVNVALTKEGEAITGKLELDGAEKTLTLKQGYINEIDNNVLVYGTWQKKLNNIKLDSEGQGLVAFKTLKENTTDKVQTVITTSLWNGATITDANYKGVLTDYTMTDGSNSPIAVFTASQLATLIGSYTSGIKLFNNFDMAGAGAGLDKWVNSIPMTNGTTFDGNKKKISNLNLQTQQAFLANLATGTYTVKDLTFENVTATIANVGPGGFSDEFGVLAKNNAGTLTVNNVAITGLDIQWSAKATDKPLCRIGGLIGRNNATVNLIKTSVAGAIDGYYSLGGFIGDVDNGGAVTIDKDCSTNVTFTQTYNSGKTMDILYAKVGGFIGTYSKASGTLTINAAAAPAAITHSHAAQEYVSDTSVENGDFYSWSNSQTYLGYCGASQLSNCTLPTFQIKKADGSAVTKTYVESYFYNSAKKVGNVNYGTKESAVYTFTKK